MTRKFRYEILFNAYTSSNKKLHQSINIMIVDHKKEKYIFTQMPFKRDDSFFYSKLDFAKYMNHLSNNEWIASPKIQFDLIDDVLTFTSLIRNFLSTIEIDGKLSKWDNAKHDSLSSLVEEIITYNIHFLES